MIAHSKGIVVVLITFFYFVNIIKTIERMKNREVRFFVKKNVKKITINSNFTAFSGASLPQLSEIRDHCLNCKLLIKLLKFVFLLGLFKTKSYCESKKYGVVLTHTLKLRGLGYVSKDGGDSRNTNITMTCFVRVVASVLQCSYHFRGYAVT